MSLGEAVALGVLQGLGEFLPISSSAHLVVAPWLVGWEPHTLAFDVALHFGTLVAIVVAFRHDWARLASAVAREWSRGRFTSSSDGRLGLGLIVATAPGALAGWLLDDWAEATFRSPLLVAAAMAALGVALFVADRRGAKARRLDSLGIAGAAAIGLAQSLAVVPGVSRSGATISMALFLGYTRDDAARFSFLLALPITFGAALVKLPDLASTALAPAAVGAAVAGVVGLVAIRWLLDYVRRRDYAPFVAYRLLFAAVVVVVWCAR